MKEAILITALILLTGCENYYRVQAEDEAKDRAEQKSQFDQYVATSRAAVRQQTATIDMNVTVCTAKANAAVPGAADAQPTTLQERARLIKWAKVSDACLQERGMTVRPRNYPAMANMKECDSASRKDMPSANSAERNSYIDDCLEAKGFNLPGHS